MSASITLRCNTVWAEGACPAAITFYCRTTPEARAGARERGWRSHPSEVDYCPACSGTRSSGTKATVRPLASRTPRQRRPQP